MLTDESLIEWASGWVQDEPPGQRARFVEAMRDELRQRATPKPVAFCTRCPFAMALHPTPPEAGDCPGYPPQAAS